MNQIRFLYYAIHGVVTNNIKSRIGDVPSYIKERVPAKDFHENEREKNNFPKRLGSIIEMINMSNFEREHIIVAKKCIRDLKDNNLDFTIEDSFAL